MFQKNVQLARALTNLTFFSLIALTGISVFAMITKQVVGLPVVLLILVGWGGMFLIQVVFPIIAVIQILTWLNRKLFAQA